MERSTNQMQLIKQEENEKNGKELKLSCLKQEVRAGEADLAVIKGRIESKKAQIAERSLMLYQKEKLLAEDTSKFKKEEGAIDEQIVMTQT